MLNKKEKDILYVLNIVKKLDKNHYLKTDFELDQKPLEDAMSYIKEEGFLLDYNPNCYDDGLQEFATRGISSKGNQFIKDHKLTRKAYKVIKATKDLIH